MQHAASLVLLRQRNTTEVYWVRRRPETSFLSGFHAFPGGLVEDCDWDDTDSEHTAIKRAALRETFEEVGVDVNERHLDYLGRWIAPPYLVRAFSTHYFLCRQGDLEPHVDDDNPELDDGEWIRPEDALNRWADGDVLIAPPTRALLNALVSQNGDLTEHSFPEPESSGIEPTLSAIRHDLMMIPLRTPTLPPATHTNTYILGRDVIFIVEPASPHTSALDELFAYLDQRLEDGAQLKAILLTHHHHDHIGGVKQTARRYNLPVWAHEETANRVPFTIHRTLNDGEVIESDPGTKWEVLHTPGHAPGHLCFLDQVTKSMVVGDMVAGLGSILVEPNDGDMTQYLESLERMRLLNPSCLLPSHGPPIGGADAKLSQYIDHRLAREADLVDALRRGLELLPDLVNAVYQDVPAPLRSGPSGGLAGMSLMSHLIKLKKESRVNHEGDRWKWPRDEVIASE